MAEGGAINSGRATLAEGDKVALNVTASEVNLVAGNRVSTITHQTGQTDSEGNQALVAEKRGTAVLAEGEVVTQTFEKCDINDVGGDQVQGDKIINVYNQTFRDGNPYVEQPGRPKTKERKSTKRTRTEIFPASGRQPMSRKHKNLCDVVNQNCSDVTKVKIVEEFRNENLNEPDFQVNPQMRKVQNYFKGGYEKVKDLEVEIKKTGFLKRIKKKVTKNQTRKEVGFHYQIKQDGDESISFNDFVTSVTLERKLDANERNAVTAIVASAGSGKSTLMHRIASESVKLCRIQEHEDYPSDERCNLKMIHFMEMKNMRFKKNLKPSQFLFDGLFETKTEVDEAYRWLLDNQSEAILYFDGLDQAPWSIKRDGEREIHKFERANSAEIMYNLLSGNLLPQVKIVIASREFKISDLPAKARPQNIVSLVGLTWEDSERLFVSLIGKKGDEIWQKIKTLSPRLLNLLSVPVFLVLTAAVMAANPGCLPPVTITELYNRILLSLRHCDHVHERNQIYDVIGKLKGMAHQGLKEGRVVFKESDLKKFGVSMKDVRDLMVKVPGNNILSRHLLEGDFVFFFCHQSLQEFLSASFVAEMETRKFSRFNKKHLHESRWSVVRMFVSGIIHDVSQVELHKVSDSTSKQQVLREAIQSGLGIHDPQKLLATIYESNNDSLIQSLPSMPVIVGGRLRADEAHMFGSILARREKTKEERIALQWCDRNDELLDIMVQNLKGRKIPVGTLDLSMNSSLSLKGFNTLLSHLDADEVIAGHLTTIRYQDLDWNNIRQILYWGMRLKNEQETVVVMEDFEGCFNKQDNTLLLRDGTECRVANARDVRSFFQPVSAEFHFERLMYTEPHDFDELQNQNIGGKISRMLIHCRKKNIDFSFIILCLRKLKVTSLDIVVDEKTSFLQSDFLTEIQSLSDISVNIHWCFNIRSKSDVKELISIAQHNEVENLRLFIDVTRSVKKIKDKYIFSIIEKCKPKKLTLSHDSDKSPLLMKPHAIAKYAGLHDVEVENVVRTGRKNHAWYFADQPMAAIDDDLSQDYQTPDQDHQTPDQDH